MSSTLVAAKPCRENTSIAACRMPLPASRASSEDCALRSEGFDRLLMARRPPARESRRCGVGRAREARRERAARHVSVSVKHHVLVGARAGDVNAASVPLDGAVLVETRDLAERLVAVVDLISGRRYLVDDRTWTLSGRRMPSAFVRALEGVLTAPPIEAALLRPTVDVWIASARAPARRATGMPPVSDLGGCAPSTSADVREHVSARRRRGSCGVTPRRSAIDRVACALQKSSLVGGE